MPHLATYVGLVDHSEQTLADSLRAVARGHAHVADVFHTCHTLADMCDDHRNRLATVVERYGEQDVTEPARLRSQTMSEAREGEVGLLRDLQDLHLLATLVQSTWTVITQGAQGLRDEELFDIATSSTFDTSRQIAWFNTRMKAAAAQALIVST
jgi:hypothetical protein